jgi:hypothetical protein
MTDATIGYLSEFWLTDPADNELKLIGEVKRIQVPYDSNFESIEATHLKSPDRRREFIDGFRADREYEVELNHVPNSESDIIIRTIASLGATVAAQIVEYDGAVPVWTHDFDIRNIRFQVSDLDVDTVRTMTVTFRVASAVATSLP